MINRDDLGIGRPILTPSLSSLRTRLRAQIVIVPFSLRSVGLVPVADHLYMKLFNFVLIGVNMTKKKKEKAKIYSSEECWWLELFMRLGWALASGPGPIEGWVGLWALWAMKRPTGGHPPNHTQRRVAGAQLAVGGCRLGENRVSASLASHGSGE